MGAGIAGGLLAFTGVWHATEWMMDGRRRDTWRLVPVGILYFILGWMIVMGVGGMITQLIALVLTGVFAFVAYSQRNTFEVRKWVTWTFIIVDVIIVLGLISALLG